MRRTNVVGTSCSGKTTLARELARRRGRVDTIVWLDYPMRTVLARWGRRTQARIRSREEFWPGTGNRESIGKAFRRDGLIWWILSTHRRRRRTFSAAIRTRTDLRWIRLRSPAEAERWLASIQPTAASPSTTAGASASAQKP